MKLALQLKMLPDADQKATLLATMERFNEAANYAAQAGFEARVFSQPSIHKLAYREIRERFGLTAQMAVRAIGKAVEVFKRDKSVRPAFKPRGAIAYDERILKFKGLEAVNLWTLAGRVVIPIKFGEYQRQRMERLKGQVDLVYREGEFYLFVTIVLPDGTPIDFKETIGVDLGVVNLATDSTGEHFSGKGVDAVRQRYSCRRKALQKVGTKNARRRLGKNRRREAHFRRQENHVISKRLVAKAQDTGAALALEDLRDVIGDGQRFRKAQRSRMKGWAFAQLRAFVAYKARLAGIPILYVDPAYTSRTCSACGHCEKANRKDRNTFACRHCGFSLGADHNAAINIKHRASVGMPMAAIADAGPRNPVEMSCKPPASAVGF